jgi:DNA-binding transcriptional MerR regulator
LGYAIYAIEMLYNTRHLTEIFSIAPSTVKKYCGIYGRFLSENARPEKGSHRLFDSEDLRVFSFIVDQLKIGSRHDDIIVSLANGARGELPTQHTDYTLTMEKGEQITLLQNRIMQLEARVLELEGERDARIRAEAERDLLRELLREAQGK